MKIDLLAMFAMALFLSSCAEGTVNSARFTDAASDLEIVYTLTGAHPFLAEFHRMLHVRFAHREVDFPLEKDTGGFLIQNVYRLPDQKILLFDGEDCVVLDLQGETIERATSRPVDPPQYLGCFDWPENDVLRFIPAAERAERRPVMGDAHAKGAPTM